MTITPSQLREICARSKSHPVKPGVCAGDILKAAGCVYELMPVKPSLRVRLILASHRVGRFLFDCFEGAGKTVRLFGVSAGGVL